MSVDELRHRDAGATFARDSAGVPDAAAQLRALAKNELVSRAPLAVAVLNDAADLIERQVAEMAELLDVDDRELKEVYARADAAEAECAALRAVLTELVACSDAAAPSALWHKHLADAWTAARAAIAKDAP